jgi:hypothetical protein
VRRNSRPSWWHVQVNHLHGGELLEDAARGQSRGGRIEAAGEGHVEAIGKEGDKDLPLGLTPARNWPVQQGPSEIDLAIGVDWEKHTNGLWAPERQREPRAGPDPQHEGAARQSRAGTNRDRSVSCGSKTLP